MSLDVQPATEFYRLTRNFTLGAALVMVIMAVVVTRGHDDQLRGQLTELAAESNADFTRTFVNTLWRTHRDHVAAAAAKGAEAVRRDPATKALLDDIARHARGLAVLKVKFYDAKGFTAFSNDLAQIGADYGANPRFLGAVTGNDTSLLEFRKTFGAIDGPRQNLWVLSSYVPIYGGDANAPSVPGAKARIEGVAEVYRDVTSMAMRIEASGLRDATITALIYTVAFLSLVAFVWHADTTMRHEYERNLRLSAAMAALEAKHDANTDLLAHMSHELRTPLNAIVGFSELMSSEVRGPIGNVDYKQYIEDIRGAGHRLLAIIENVLDLVRVDSGELRPSPRTVEPEKIAATAIEGLKASLAARGQSVDILARHTPRAIVTDPAMVERILTCLLANAAKFSPPGSRITLAIEQDKDAATRIAVADEGPGMSEDSMLRAKVPFGHVAGAFGRRQKGTGLGLPVSLRLAQALGGDLDITSRPGAGTTVTLSLPARTDSARNRQAA